MANWREIGGTVQEENWPIILATYTNSSETDPTSLTTFETYNMPAGTMGATDSLIIYMSWNTDYPNASNNVVITFNSNTICDVNLEATTESYSRYTMVHNLAIDSQITGLGSGISNIDDEYGLGALSVQGYTSSVNTGTTSIPIAFKGQLGGTPSGNYLTLDAYIYLLRSSI